MQDIESINTFIMSSRTGLMRQVSMSDDIRQALLMGDGLDKNALRNVVKCHLKMGMEGEELDDFVNDLFRTCDTNGDNKVELFEFEQAMLASVPDAGLLDYVKKLIEDADITTVLAQAIINSVTSSDTTQMVDEKSSENAIDEITKEGFDFSSVLGQEQVKVQLAQALQQQCKDVRELRAKSEAAEKIGNSKFGAMDGTYEGAYGTIENFLEGIEKIGLPQPRIYQGSCSSIARAHSQQTSRLTIPQLAHRCRCSHPPG